jgi:hypothetical protein
LEGLHLIERKNTTGSSKGKNFHILVILVTTALSLASFPILVLTSGSNFRVLENDTVAILIKPIADNIYAQCSSSTSNSFVVGWSPNQTASSLIWLQPTSFGIYNLTVFFSVKSPWNYSVEVYTTNFDFYGSTDINYTLTGASYITLYTIPTIQSAGNYTLNFIITVVATNPLSIFNFKLPASVNGVFFIAIVFALGYVNIFYIASLYFRQKTEGISRRQWILVSLLIIISLVIIYIIYISLSV